MHRGHISLVSLISFVFVSAIVPFANAEMMLYARTDEPLSHIDGTYGSSTLSWQRVPCAAAQECFVTFLDASTTPPIASTPQPQPDVTVVSAPDYTAPAAPAGSGSGGGGGPITFAEPATVEIPTSTPMVTMNTPIVSTTTAQTEVVYTPPAVRVKVPPVFTKHLHKGMRGPQVRVLQQILIDQNLLKIKKPTGYYGVMTQSAVKKFQRTHHLEAVGSVGPKTRALLNSMN